MEIPGDVSPGPGGSVLCLNVTGGEDPRGGTNGELPEEHLPLSQARARQGDSACARRGWIHSLKSGAFLGREAHFVLWRQQFPGCASGGVRFPLSRHCRTVCCQGCVSGDGAGCRFPLRRHCRTVCCQGSESGDCGDIRFPLSSVLPGRCVWRLWWRSIPFEQALSNSVLPGVCVCVCVWRLWWRLVPSE